MGIFGGAFNIVGGLLASPPKVPSIEKLNPLQTALESTSVNRTNLPGLTDLARDTTRAQSDILLETLRRTIPRFDEIFAKESQNTSDFLSGVIPQDVQNAIARKSGSRAVAGGFGYGSARTNLEARDLGLTSLDIMKTGMDTGGRWLQQAAALTTPAVFNISSMFLNPTQIYQMENEQNLQQFQRQFAKNQIDNPYKFNNILSKQFIDTGNEIDKIGTSVLSAYVGGLAGGAGGGGGQTQPPPGTFGAGGSPYSGNGQAYSFDPTFGSGASWY